MLILEVGRSRMLEQSPSMSSSYLRQSLISVPRTIKDKIKSKFQIQIKVQSSNSQIIATTSSSHIKAIIGPLRILLFNIHLSRRWKALYNELRSNMAIQGPCNKTSATLWQLSQETWHWIRWGRPLHDETRNNMAIRGPCNKTCAENCEEGHEDVPYQGDEGHSKEGYWGNEHMQGGVVLWESSSFITRNVDWQRQRPHKLHIPHICSGDGGMVMVHWWHIVGYSLPARVDSWLIMLWERSFVKQGISWSLFTLHYWAIIHPKFFWITLFPRPTSYILLTYGFLY